MFRSLHMKLTLIMILLIASLMAVVGAFLTANVSTFYIDTFYEQVESVFGADQREFVTDLRNVAAESDGAPSYETVEGETPKEVTLADLSIFDFEFSKRDIDASYDDKVINVGTPDSDYEITSEGSYIFSGDITDVQIRVKAGDNEKIQIVLSNASIKNSKKARYISPLPTRSLSPRKPAR